MIARLLAALLASVVLLGPGSTGVVAYLCSMSGGLVTECCCKPGGVHDDAEQEAEQHAKLERQGCCALQIVQGTRVPATVERAELAHALQLAVVAEPLLLAAPVRVRLARPESARGPPPHHGPPLFVRNCSFLI